MCETRYLQPRSEGSTWTLASATACAVADALGVSAEAQVYDVSNACLGLINGAVQIAMMIEAGVIEAGLVVGTENSV